MNVNSGNGGSSLRAVFFSQRFRETTERRVWRAVAVGVDDDSANCVVVNGPHLRESMGREARCLTVSEVCRCLSHFVRDGE